MVARWNKAKIEKLLRENVRAVERAMVVLYDRQTSDEKATSDTRHTNQRGFSACHAKRGSYYGRWCKSGKRLTGDHIGKARSIALHYTQQLADEANARDAAKVRVGGTAETVEDAERAMQRMEAEGDRAQTRREEEAKWAAREAMERPSNCLKRVNSNISCFCSYCMPDAPPPVGET